MTIDNDAVSLIDAMPRPHYQGGMVLYDRAGHIPGASNIPASELLDESGRYRSHNELASLFDGNRNTRAITYCGGGISASSDAFIMTRLGFTDVAVCISGSADNCVPTSRIAHYCRATRGTPNKRLLV